MSRPRVWRGTRRHRIEHQLYIAMHLHNHLPLPARLAALAGYYSHRWRTRKLRAQRSAIRWEYAAGGKQSTYLRDVLHALDRQIAAA